MFSCYLKENELARHPRCAALGATAGDRHTPRAVLTRIDAKLAEPPVSFGWLAPTSAGIAPLLNAAFSEKLFKSLSRISPDVKPGAVTWTPCELTMNVIRIGPPV